MILLSRLVNDVTFSNRYFDMSLHNLTLQIVFTLTEFTILLHSLSFATFLKLGQLAHSREGNPNRREDIRKGL